MGIPEKDAAEVLELCLVAVLSALKRLGAAPWQLGDHDANSLAQETFIKISTGKNIRNPRRIVWSVARNTVLDALKAAGRFSRWSLDDISQDRLAASDQVELSVDEINALLDDVMKDLPPRDKAVLSYARTNGIDLSNCVAIGKGLGITPNAVAVSRQRIRERAKRFRPGFDELEGR